LPELPEVHTTVKGLRETVVGLKISGVWTNYKSPFYRRRRASEVKNNFLLPSRGGRYKGVSRLYKDQIKNPVYFKKFKKEVVGTKITSATRRAKNILIHLSNGKTILIHLKMTGHLMYGFYEKTGLGKGDEKWQNEVWQPKAKSGHLRDPFNRFIRLVFSFSNGKHLVLSDVRRFAKVQILDTKTLHELPEFKKIGPEPLETSFTFKVFLKQISGKPNWPIKSALMAPEVVAGIGNIYSDEILWKAGVHPESKVKNIPKPVLKKIFTTIKPTLRHGIKFKGDSTSDYRNIDGRPGEFSGKHNAYQKTGEKCHKKDGGVIVRKVVRGRSAHFCSKHQVRY